MNKIYTIGVALLLFFCTTNSAFAITSSQSSPFLIPSEISGDTFSFVLTCSEPDHYFNWAVLSSPESIGAIPCSEGARELTWEDFPSYPDIFVIIETETDSCNSLDPQTIETCRGVSDFVNEMDFIVNLAGGVTYGIDSGVQSGLTGLLSSLISGALNVILVAIGVVGAYWLTKKLISILLGWFHKFS